MLNTVDSPIPIENIYYLLCYAWNRLDEKDVVDVSSLKSTQLVDLFARVLISGTHHLVRRGFDRGYLGFSEDTRRPRGKIDFARTLKRNLLNENRLGCDFDELDYNVLHNRILKTTIKSVMLVENLDKELKEGLHEINRRLWEIDEISLTSQLFRRVQLHRNNYYYGFILSVCELVFDALFASEERGKLKFRDFARDEKKMAKLFESFVKNFYVLEQNRFKVQSLKIEWQVESGNDPTMSFLPEMKTDVCLTSPQRKIILECKFYRDALQTNWQKRTLHSAHMYQLFAYLRNKESDDLWQRCEGILLYPTVRTPLNLIYTIHGHRIRIRTVNLDQDWRSIHNEMLDLIAA
jgi:5-methylcytosine-specific restriction enzyme subunit McrC